MTYEELLAIKFVMTTFLKRNNISCKTNKSKTSNSLYIYFAIKMKKYVLRISDHYQDNLNYDFLIMSLNDISFVQKRISKLI